jgi:hypothetical protein
MNARPAAEKSQKPLVIPPVNVIKHEPMLEERFSYSCHLATIVGYGNLSQGSHNIILD